MNSFILTYDIGGTFVKFGLFNDAGQLIKKGKFPSKLGPELLKSLVDHGKAVAQKFPLKGIGVGIPGLIKDGVVKTSVNLGLTDVPLRQVLEKDLGVPVTVANDATLAAWGEKQAGSPADPANFLLVTIGTGIGSGIVLEDQLMEGKYGSFGELGHTVIQPGGRPCKCGNKGCLEQYVSIGGLLANYKELYGQTITMGQLVMAEAAQVEAVLEESAQKLGLALANAAILLDLRMILVGGGLSEIHGFIPKIRYWTNYYAMPSIQPIQVEKASLGNDAALYGAYHLIKSQVVCHKSQVTSRKSKVVS